MLMRYFVVKAGVDPSRLQLALEPECASAWWETLGGTADISVHERNPDGTLKEIHKASGGPWGGTNWEKAITTGGKDKLKIDTTVVKSWFKRPIELLMQHLKSLLAEQKMKSVQTVILVGGFGESPYVKERMRNEIAGVRLIVPSDAGLAVLKGAVRFGHKPAIVSSMVVKYTYGHDVYGNFDEKKHPDEKKVWKNGKWWVPKWFNVFVLANTELRVDQQVTRRSTPNSEISLTYVYRSTQENNEFTTEHGCQLVGTVELENSTDIPFEQQVIETTFMFGNTELLVKMKNTPIGKEAYMIFK
ncbi:HS12A-like protein [Mya arenaria]|uniref:HS12A-like protein n=1 Tax=Mya arenaria TaxID=6604 RepID=A0ABY7EVU0_MYAAR|nr:HS12A-like protein [Mya arenaria]